MNLVRTAPHARSMRWRHSAESASFSSGSVSCANAVSISCLVNAENLALPTFFPARLRSRAVSRPIESLPRGQIGGDDDLVSDHGQVAQHPDEVGVMRFSAFGDDQLRQPTSVPFC